MRARECAFARNEIKLARGQERNFATVQSRNQSTHNMLISVKTVLNIPT